MKKLHLVLLSLQVFASLNLIESFQSRVISRRSFTTNLFASDTSLEQITIPKRYTDARSPIHGNLYPSLLHTIHIADILTPEQASKCLRIAEEHAEISGCWSSKDSERHVSYSTADFPIEDCQPFEKYLEEIDFERNIFERIGKLYDLDPEDLEFLDLFCAHYEGKEKDDGENDDFVMDSLAEHRDGTLISFTCVLSEANSYQGGGTLFDALKGNDLDDMRSVLSEDGVVKVNNCGQGVIHCGKILHGAHLVSKGERTTLTGFVDVHSRCIREGVLGEACKEFGRMDNAKKRLQRQVIKTNDGCYGWESSNSKYLTSSVSSYKGFIPKLSSTERRGDTEFQRVKNLETEDILLRDVLLPREDRIHPSDFIDLSQFGDITIL